MASSPFQDLSAGSPTAQSVDVYRAGNPALWGNQYAAIQTGQLQVGKPYQWQAGDEWSGPVGPIITYVPILNADGTDTGWKAEQIAPNVYDLVTTNRDYVQHMVVRADPNSGYIEPIQDTSKQVNFGRWNYSGSGLSQFFQNPIAPLMLSALLPGAGSAIGAALGLEEGAVSSAIGTGLLSGTTTAAAGGDFAKGALTGGLGNLLGSALNTPTSVPGAEEVAAAQAASQAINPDSVFTPAVATPVPNQTNLVPQVLPPMEALTNNTSAVSSLPTIPENSIWDSYTGSFVPSTQTPSSLFPNILNNDQNNMVINFAQDVPATSDLYNLAPSTPSTGLGLQATQGEGINLFAPAQGIEGGGLGLQLPTVSNLDSMGGAQGLTTLASGGSGLLGETGLGTTSTTITNPITGQPLGQELSNINTGVTDVTGAPVSTPSTTGNVPNSLIKQLVNTLLGSNMADNTNTAALGSGLLGGAGNLLQGQYAKDAAQMIADRMATATGSAVAGSQFRPVGITTRFGASNFTVNPQTGQLESAGYTPTALSDQLQQGAQSVYNLGKGYVAQSPQEAAQSWLQAQQNLLAPSRDVALSNIRNNLFQTGREGLSVAQGGDLQSANPELAAYYNSLANQNAQLAAQAQQFGQQQAQFGTGLLGSGLNLMSGLNTLEQQPLTLGAGLGQQASAAGARAGQLGIMGTQAGQKYLMDAATYSPLANILTGVSRNPLGSQAVGNLLSQYIPQLGNWISGLSSIPGGGGLPDLTNYNLTSDNATNFWSY